MMNENGSFISEKAIIGKDVKIGRFVIIEDGVQIGDGTSVGDYTIIMAGTIIGKNCRIKSYCEIRREVIIGDNCGFGSRCTLTHFTKVGNNVDVKFGFVTTTLDFKKKIDLQAGVIGDNTVIGANVILMPGANIGKNAIIGACSQLRHEVADNEVWYGSPAKFYKKTNEF